jgi:lysophospholipase L1-like esterase
MNKKELLAALKRQNHRQKRRARAIKPAGIAGLTNWTAENTSSWSAAKAQVIAGTGNARLLFIGNSITAGSGATGDTTGTYQKNNAAAASYPTRLAEMLNASALPASWNSFIGGQYESDWHAHDNRIDMGGWTDYGLGSIGANVLAALGETGVKFSFTPSSAFDTVEVLGIYNGEWGIYVSVDEQPSAASVTMYNSQRFGDATICSPIDLGEGYSTISVEHWANAGLISGLIASNSQRPEVLVMRAGWFGATIGNLTGATLGGIEALRPDMTVIAMTVNDPATGITPEDFKAQYQMVIDAAKISGDVMLMIEPQGVNGDDPLQLAFAQYVRDLGSTNNIPVFDMGSQWRPYAANEPFYFDGIHPNGSGYSDIGAKLAPVFLQ